MKCALIIGLGLLALGSTSVIPDDSKCGENEELGWIGGCSGPNTCPKEFEVPMCSPMPLIPACVCIPRFYRNHLGECISKDQCDICSKPNEFYACNSACDNECRKIKTQSRKNCPIKTTVQCVKRCYCEDGYARDDRGNCIPVDECPAN